MNVQAFIDNISFPKSLEELDWFIDEFDVEQVLTVSETEWTAPKWTVKGDIVFFYHAKTAIQWISKLETKIKKERNRTEDNIFPLLFGEAFKKTMEESFQKDCDAQLDALQRGRKLYKKYGGKIFAIGQVSGRPIYDSQEGDEVLHWASRFYAPIDKIYVLQNPIDISEFSNFIFLSRQSAITPVVGNDFERLKNLIATKNEIPKYLKESAAIPLPLQKINAENWLEITKHYRRLFQLEIQFRRFYVDYFLRALGDQKKFYAECQCYKNGKRTGFADNAIKIGGKWCFVEVKLNVNAEQHLSAQLQKYSQVEGMIAKEEEVRPQEKLWQNCVLVIDTENFYRYDALSDKLDVIKNLDEIHGEEDIKYLRDEIIKRLP